MSKFLIKSGLRLLLSLGVGTAVFCAGIISVYADAIVWEGDVNNNWSECGNWEGGLCPGTADLATFNDSGNVAATIDTAIDVGGIVINAGYTQTITQGAGITIEVGSQHFTQNDGEFAGSNGTDPADKFDMDGGDFILNSGTFTAPRGSLWISNDWTDTGDATFTHNSGTVYFNTNPNSAVDVNASETFNDLVIDKGDGSDVDIASGDRFIVTGNLQLTDGQADLGIIEVHGNAVFDTDWDGGTATFEFKEDATQTITCNDDDIGHKITVDKTGGSLDLASDLELQGAAADLVITAGVVNVGTYTLTVDDDDLDIAGTLNAQNGNIKAFDVIIQNGGTLNAPGDGLYFRIWGAYTNTGTGVLNEGDGTIAFRGSNQNVSVHDTNGETFNNLKINKSDGADFDIVSSRRVIVTGDLELEDGQADLGVIEVRGDILFGVDWDAGTATFEFTGDATQTLTCNDADIRQKITVDKTGGSLDFATDIDMETSTADFVIAADTVVNMSTYELEIDDDLDITGTLNAQSSNLNVTDVIIQNGGTLNAPGDGQSFVIWGAYTNTGTGVFNEGDGTVIFRGANQNVTVHDTNGETFNNLTINKNDGTDFDIVSSRRVIVTGDLQLTNGQTDLGVVEVRGNAVFDTNWDGGTATYEFTDSATQTLTCNDDDIRQKITVDKTGGSLDFTTDIDMEGAVADFVIAADTVVNLSTYELEITDDLDITGTLNAQSGNLNLFDVIIQNGGTLNAPGDGQSFVVSGAWTNTGTGVFNEGDGTVEFIGSNQNVNVHDTNGETFNNLTINKNNGTDFDIVSSRKIIVNGTLWLQNGDADLGDLEAYGDITIGSWWDSGTAELIIKGGETQTLTCNDSEFRLKTTVDKTEGTALNIDSTLNFVGADADFILTEGVVNLGDNTMNNDDNFQIDGGTFNGETGTMDLIDVIINGGTFNAPSGTMSLWGTWDNTAGAAAFEAGSGTVTMNDASETWNPATGETFNNYTLQMNDGANLTLASGSLIFEGDLELTQGQFLLSSLTAQGDVTIAGTYDPVTTTELIFTGTADQNLNGGDRYDDNVTINKTSGSVILGENLLFDASGQTLTITEGTLDLNGYDITVDSTFTFQDGGHLRLKGDETMTGTATFNTGSSATYYGTDASYTLPNLGYEDLIINGGATSVFSLGASESVNDLTITSGILYLDDNDLTVANDFDNSGTLRMQGSEVLILTNGNDTGSGIIEYVGNGDASADDFVTDDLTFYDLKMNFTDSGDGLIMSGQKGLNTLDDDMFLYWQLDDEADPTSDSSGNGRTGNLTNMEAGDWVDGCPDISFTNVKSLEFDGSADFVEFTSDDGFSSRTVSMWFYAVGVQDREVLYQEGGTTNGMALYLDSGNLYGAGWGSGITDRFISTPITDSAWHHVALVYDGGAMELFLNGVSKVSADTGGDMPAHSANDTIGARLGGMKFHDSAPSGMGDYFEGKIDDFRIYDKALTSSDIVFLADGEDTNAATITITSLPVNGGLILDSGTFNAPATVTIGGDFDRSGGGVFTHNSGIVVFNNASQTSVIDGSTTFNNLKSIAAGKNLTFTAGTTQTVIGTLTLTGASGIGNAITLRSSTPTSAWNIVVNGAISGFDYLDVQDSNASGTAAPFEPGENSTDSLRNVGWSFNATATVGSLVVTPATDGTGEVTIEAEFDDEDDDDTVEALYEYDIGGGFIKIGELSEVAEDISATYGTVAVENDDEYQGGNASGYITTSSGANTVIVTWDSLAEVSEADLSTAQIRITPYDGTDVGTPQTSSNFKLDNVDPTGLGSFASGGSTANSMTWTWSAASDTNFDHYEIWYGTDESDVENRTGTATEWDDSDDVDLATAGTVSTTITGLTEDLTYYARIWAVDTYANESVLAADSVSTNTAPTGLANFVATSATSSSIEWGWDEASDVNFNHYEIWYGTDQSDVENRIGTAAEWDSFDDSDLTDEETTSTTITGLAEDTTYYAKIWAIDDNGNEATLSAATANNNGRPTLSNLTASQSLVGDGLVTISFKADDLDNDNTIQVLIEGNIGSGWVDLESLLEDPENIDATYGTVAVENDNPYQIGNASGYITSSSGINTITVVFDSQTQFPTASTSAAEFRVTPYDGIETGAQLSVSDVLLDNLAPSGLADFSKFLADSSDLTLSWTAATSDASFDHYEIWYGEDQSDVDNRIGTAIEWDNDDDSALTTMATAITTITSLSEGISYFVKIYAIDDVGNVATLDSISAATNNIPTVTSVGIATATDGTGEVTLTIVADDGDDENVELAVDYSLDGGSTWAQATLSEESSDIEVENGTAPGVENDDDRQVGAISTTAGENTITLVWNSLVDEPTANVSVAQIRAIANDGIESGTPTASLDFVLDNVAPSILVVTSATNYESYDDEVSVTISGTKSSGTSVNLDGVEIVAASVSTTWTYGTTISQGGNVYVFTQLDASGNVSAETTHSIVLSPPPASYGGGGGGGGGSGGTSSTVYGAIEVIEEVEETVVEEEEEVEEIEEEEVTEIEEVIEVVIEEVEEIVEDIEEAIEDHSTSGTSSSGDTKDIPEWREEVRNDFLELDVMQDAQIVMESLQVPIFDFLFDSNSSMSRIEVLQLSLLLFGSDLCLDCEVSMDNWNFTDIAMDDRLAIFLEEGRARGIGGYDDGSFEPDRKANRVEALKMLLNAAEIEIVLDPSMGLLDNFGLAENPFVDVDLNQWYAPYVLYAYSQEIVQGYPDGTFRVASEITWAEFFSLVTSIYMAQTS